MEHFTFFKLQLKQYSSQAILVSDPLQQQTTNKKGVGIERTKL